MKKKNIIYIISLLLILLITATSCNSSLFSPTDTSGSTLPAPSATDATDRIAELEAKIVALMQSQELSKTEQQKLIAELKAELESLKSTEKPKETSAPAETEPPTTFSYTIQNGRAVITDIITKEESITIPSVIDSYQVVSIGSEALSSDTVKSVIISSGIQKIDWFAFSGCFALSSVSIPDSVTSVGYGAFDNTAKNLTIHCSRDSFAHKYAQSYGITYDIT